MTTASDGSSELAPTPTPRTLSSSIRRSAWRSLAAIARATPAGESAAVAPAGAPAPAVAGQVKDGAVEAGPTKLTPKADVTSEMRFPMVTVLLPAKSRAMGCAVSAVTIKEPESPAALNDALLIST